MKGSNHDSESISSDLIYLRENNKVTVWIKVGNYMAGLKDPIFVALVHPVPSWAISYSSTGLPSSQGLISLCS